MRSHYRRRRASATSIFGPRAWRLALPIALCLVAVSAAACGGSEDDRARESATSKAASSSSGAAAELCALFTPSIQTRIDSGITAVLAEAERESTEPSGAAFVQRFTAGSEWVELRYEEAGTDASGLSKIGDALATDGVRRSRATLQDRSIDVVANASDPAGISTWHASLVGAGALAPVR